jgi:hypothetical protein
MKMFMENTTGVYIRVRGKTFTQGSVFPTTWDETGVRVADFTGAQEIQLTDLRASINGELRRRRK